MNHEILIIQRSPRREIIFYEEEFELKGSQDSLIERSKYSELRKVAFVKGSVPWLWGFVSATIDLLSGHGVGEWKRGKGTLTIEMSRGNHALELKNYDREQTPLAVQMLKEKMY